MPRLSIVIPGLAFDSTVEDTLVSVLQNRPEYSEVIVMTSHDYKDPYGLGREVRFMTTESATNQIDLINQACRQASGDVIHLLLPGTVVTDGWTDRIWNHFADDEVAAVAPVVAESSQSTRAIAAGVTYLPRGERRAVGAGLSLDSPRLSSLSILGPILSGGFYRRDILLALGGFDATVGEFLADVELGLALRDLGFRAVVEPNSRVVSARSTDCVPRGFAEAQQAERLFRQRMSADSGVWPHRLMVVAEMLKGFARPRMVTRVMGRMAAKREESQRAAYEARLQQAREELAQRSQNVATIPMKTKVQANRMRLRAAA